MLVLSPGVRKPTIWILTRSDTNRAVQLLEMARGLKFCILEVEVLYYPSSENKGDADLRLCFRICKILVFSRRGSFPILVYRTGLGFWFRFFQFLVIAYLLLLDKYRFCTWMMRRPAEEFHQNCTHTHKQTDNDVTFCTIKFDPHKENGTWQ